MAVGLTSCAQWPWIAGAYKDRLTYQDVVEIRALIRARSDIQKPIIHIWMHWPDRALLDCGEPAHTGEIMTSLIVYRKNGHWVIDEKSIERSPAIVISQNEPIGPNKSLQPTATRCTFTFSMIKTVPEIISLAPGSRG